MRAAPAIGSDGTIYIGSRDDYFYAINPDGSLEWKFETGSDIDTSAAIGADGTIYVASQDSNLYAIRPDGSLKWMFGIQEYGSAPAIGSDGAIYVGSRDTLDAVNPNGTLKWTFPVPVDGSSPTIARDGTVLIGSRDHNLYAINDASGGMAQSAWPIFQHDRKHTGNFFYSGGKSSLVVTILSLGAIDAGAKWRVDEGFWQDSGTTISELEQGEHTIRFKDIDGWIPPEIRTVTVVGDQMTEIIAVYTQETGRLPDTGQTQCYIYDWVTDTWDDGPCSSPGEALYGQDGNYLINSPSYTKLDENGNDLPDDAAKWVMVRDNVTGLIWELKRNNDGVKNYDDPHDADNTYQWYDPDSGTNGGNEGAPLENRDTNSFADALNSTLFGGFNDWRLPNIIELQSILDYARYDPAVNTLYFPYAVSSYYWSSTTYVASTDYAWSVLFNYGADGRYQKSDYCYVRAVRGGYDRSLGHLINNGDGTITDLTTGLMWQQKTASASTWTEALSYCDALQVEGYDDWRLPNSQELRSIVDHGKYNPAIDTVYFTNAVSSDYWSSTSYSYRTYFGWDVHLWSGGGGYGRIKSEDGYVLAVRGGQNWISGRLFILTPTQGAKLVEGETQAITWQPQDLAGNVNISLSREGGKEGTFETISHDTENDGTYEWTVTGPVSANCVLKIEPSQDTSKGTSQGLFSIYAPPIAITGFASGIGGDMATLNGTVNPGFLPTAVVFEWGEAETYGNEINATQSPLTGGGAQNVSGTLHGLTPATTYHYRVRATNSAGTSYGEDKVFTTEAVLPSVTTMPVTSIGPNTAQGGGEVTADGGAEVTARGICWSTSPNPTIASDKTMDGTGIGSFTSSMTGLAPGTTYHVRAYATSSAGTAYGSDILFSTLILAPSAATDPATSVGPTSATLNGMVNPNGASTTVVFQYGTDTNYGSTVTASQSPLTGSTAQPVTATISGLTPATTYHFRASATNVEGSANGEDQSFTTGTNVPTVTTAPVSSIGSTSASCGGSVTSSGGANVTSRGVCWGTSANPTIADNHTSDGTGTGEFTSQIGDLTPNTPYHVRAYATNSAGTGYGDNVSFTTSEAAPIVEIQSGNGPRGKTTTLPTVLTNIPATEVAAITVDVAYDPIVFNNPTALVGPASSAASKTIATNEVASGLFRITIFSPSNNDPIGDGVIVYLTLNILSNAPTNTAVLTCTPMGSNPSGAEVFIEGKDATVTILGNMEGDCNGDGTVTIAEVQTAINMYLGIIPVLDCVDVNGNGKVSIGEVQKVINNHLGLTAPEMAVFSYNLSPDSKERFFNPSKAPEGANLPSLIVGQAVGEPGDTITIPLMLSNVSGYDISAISTDIAYDATILENPSVRIGPAGTAAGKSVVSNEPSQGTLRIGILSVSNNNAIGSGVVGYLTFTVKAASGRTIIGNSPEGSDPLGNDVPMVGKTGIVTAAQVVYVDLAGGCDGNTPCFSSIQTAIDSGTSYALILICEGNYNEDVIVDKPYGLSLLGGWDSTFTTQGSETHISSLIITETGGTVEVDKMVLQ